MTTHIWLRAEEKPLEERTALTPEAAKMLLDQGFQVTVEESAQRAIAIDAYRQAGCDIVAQDSWRQAPRDVLIYGLKELNESDEPLQHRHIHFAHVYKYQSGWQDVLTRFKTGGGELYDLEFLVDENKRRVAAFGYWAGYTGAAVALRAWAGQKLDQRPVLSALSSKNNKQALLDELVADIAAAVDKGAEPPKVLVIGARGRSGRGAVELVRAAGLEVLEWDLEETRAGGPFSQILDADVMVNCVFVQSATPPFITTEMLQASAQRRLSVISDVSCDPYGDYNPLPIYSQCTNFSEPTLRLIDGDNPLDLISIDHLPSLLPVEASEDFCDQLLPHLLQLDRLEQGVWGRALDVFQQKLAELD